MKSLKKYSNLPTIEKSQKSSSTNLSKAKRLSVKNVKFGSASNTSVANNNSQSSSKSSINKQHSHGSSTSELIKLHKNLQNGNSQNGHNFNFSPKNTSASHHNISSSTSKEFAGGALSGVRDRRQSTGITQKVTYRHIGLESNQGLHKSAMQGISNLSIKVQAVSKTKKARSHTHTGIKSSKKSKKKDEVKPPPNLRTVPTKQTINFYRHKVQTQFHYPFTPLRHTTLPQVLLDRLETIQNLEKATYNSEMDHEENKRKRKKDSNEGIQNDLVLPLSNQFIEEWNKTHHNLSRPVSRSGGLAIASLGQLPAATENSSAQLHAELDVKTQQQTSTGARLGSPHTQTSNQIGSNLILGSINPHGSTASASPHGTSTGPRPQGVAIFQTVANSIHGFTTQISNSSNSNCSVGSSFNSGHSNNSKRSTKSLPTAAKTSNNGTGTASAPPPNAYPEMSKYVVSGNKSKTKLNGGVDRLRSMLVSRENFGGDHRGTRNHDAYHDYVGEGNLLRRSK